MPQTDSVTVQVQSALPLQISVQAPPVAPIGQPYSYQLTPVESGGTLPYLPLSFVVSLALPPGLTCNSTGLISGTPTGSPTVGQVTISGTDSGN